jgi:hypothetical protein
MKCQDICQPWLAPQVRRGSSKRLVEKTLPPSDLSHLFVLLRGGGGSKGGFFHLAQLNVSSSSSTSSSCSGDGHSCWLWLGVMTPCTAQPGTKPSNAQIIILHTFCQVLKPFQRTLLIIFKSSWYLVVYTFLRLLLLRDLTLLLLLLPTDDSGQIEQGTFFPFLHSCFGSWKKKEKSVKKELDQNRAIEISNGNERTRQTLLLSRSLCHNTLKQKRHLLAANQGWQMTAWIYTFSQTFFSGDLMALLTLISTWTQLQKSRTFLSTLLQTAISYQELKTPITHKKSIWVRRQLCTSSSSTSTFPSRQQHFGNLIWIQQRPLD